MRSLFAVLICTLCVSSASAQELRTLTLREPRELPALQRIVHQWLNQDEVVRTVAQAQTSSSQPRAQQTTERRPSEPRHLILGFELDAGIPYGIGGAVVVRPLHWLRLFLGGAFNLISGGIRGGASVGIPVGFILHEVGLGFEAGHLFEGDANWIADVVTGRDISSAALRQVSYDYVNGVLRLEFGVEMFRLVLEGGVAYVNSVVYGLTADVSDPDIEISDGRVEAVLPVGKIGVSIYFL